MEITETIARKVLEVVDAGLVSGVGNPVPGQMCVEAAVCYAMGLPHGDEPSCVSPALRHLKIRLNDCAWSSGRARAKGLRRLAVAQLGSAGVLDDKEFIHRVIEMASRKIVPIALRAAAVHFKGTEHEDKLLVSALRCEREGTREAVKEAKKIAAYAAAYAAPYADAASAAAYAAIASADADAQRDRVLTIFADEVVAILVEMDAPGCQWLPLCA